MSSSLGVTGSVAPSLPYSIAVFGPLICNRVFAVCFLAGFPSTDVLRDTAALQSAVTMDKTNARLMESPAWRKLQRSPHAHKRRLSTAKVLWPALSAVYPRGHTRSKSLPSPPTRTRTRTRRVQGPVSNDGDGDGDGDSEGDGDRNTGNDVDEEIERMRLEHSRGKNRFQT